MHCEVECKNHGASHHAIKRGANTATGKVKTTLAYAPVGPRFGSMRVWITALVIAFAKGWLRVRSYTLVPMTWATASETASKLHNIIQAQPVPLPYPGQLAAAAAAAARGKAATRGYPTTTYIAE